MTRRISAGAVAALLLLVSPQHAAARERPLPPPTCLPELQVEIRRLAAAVGGVVGVTAAHLESGESVSLNARQRFPMASVFKLPIAMRLLHQVDRGQVSLDSSVAIARGDLRLGDSPITRHWRPGRTQTVRQLLEAMLVHSDNTAADLLLRVAGGPVSVDSRLRELGLDGGIRIDRSEADQMLDFYGLRDGAPPESEWSPQMFVRLVEGVPDAARLTFARAWIEDPRDSATPAAMCDLLASVQRGEALEPATTMLLLDCMQRARTGHRRLRGLLPADTPVAHKTGTYGTTGGITAAINDAGLVTLPDGSHVAIAVFVKASTRGLDSIERGIARISRATYDYWTQQGAAGAVSDP